jgi:mRNA-degrading endonuclease toxin of MazEF toxin-antitoxin module
VSTTIRVSECEDVKSVSEQRLIAQLGTVDEQVAFGISRALRFLLDL